MSGEERFGFGLFLHPALAVDAETGACLGLADYTQWGRKPKEKGQKISDAPGTYTYTLTVTTAGCTPATAMTTSIVNSRTPLEKPAVTSNGPVCHNGTLNLSVDPGSSGPFTYV